ncbi:MAG: adenosine deaminase [Candidatus Pacebacteria bacterium CG10_big_fil_rev_8_21_14_0_10_42_12]|nr:MAG: adenosine deaminase [Candidatus Pacebacteria bacterium CG10_big_fil_rev_8_21_14_0_10_42_12]
MVQNQHDPDVDMSFLDGVELCELHTHLGFSISPTMLWELAHDQGLKLPANNYWDFEKVVTIHESKTYEEYLKMYDLTERIQSSPQAMFIGMQSILSGAYRKNNISKLEVRGNPLLRTRDREVDVDYIITFALQGLEKGMLKYPIKSGLIFIMDRRFDYRMNEIIVEKAIKYKDRGVIGVDLAGPIERTDTSKKFKPEDIKDLIDRAREAGLGITIHTGEATGTDEMWEVVEYLKPTRIGHGFACYEDESLMKRLVDDGTVLELCPTSNLNTSKIKDYDEMRHVYQTIRDHGVKFTINTDGPEMQLTSLKTEYERLIVNNIFTKEDLLKANQTAHEASFIH